jgi:branched-chain amino acid transport system substrate-binding protein
MRRFLLLVLVVSLVGCGQRPAPEPVFLGMLQPLSGPGRVVGEQARHAVELAVADFAARDIRVNHRELIVLHADSGDSPATVRAETVRLLTINRTPALIGMLPPAEAEVFFREARLLSYPAVLAGEVATPPTGDGLLSLGAGPAVRGRALAKFVRENLKLTKVGVLVDDGDPLAVNLAAAFTRELREEPSVRVEEAHYTTPAEGTSASKTADDRSAAIKTLVERQPGAVLLGDPVKGRRWLADAGLNVPTLAGGADTTAPVLDAGPAQYRVTVFAGTDLTAAGQDFVKKYQSRFGEAPSVAAALSWEAVRLVGETMSAINSPSALRLREELGKQPFEGITGPIEFRERQARRRLFAVKTQADTSVVERIFAPGE